MMPLKGTLRLGPLTVVSPHLDISLVGIQIIRISSEVLPTGFKAIPNPPCILFLETFVSPHWTDS